MSLDDSDSSLETERDIERSRKEKYVTEFTARFARNFLYPLDGAVSIRTQQKVLNKAYKLPFSDERSGRH